VGHTKTFNSVTILILVYGRGKVSVEGAEMIQGKDKLRRGTATGPVIGVEIPKKGTFGQNWPLNNDETDIISNDSFRKGVS
jgi:hypothetical protein